VATVADSKKKIISLLKSLGAVRSEFPDRIEPMLATKMREPFDDDDFIYELKWDGYRIIGYKNGKNVSLRSRSNQEFSASYSSIAESLRQLPFKFVVDGEVVMLDKNGLPSFDDLQQVRTLGTSSLSYCIFDLIWCEGYDLRNLPLTTRKDVLEQVMAIASASNLKYYPYLSAKGKELFRTVQEQGLEGIVAKRADSRYKAGERSTKWLKIQTKIRQEFVIGGWTESESGRPFRSLLFGYYNENEQFVYYGHSGSGYTDKRMKEIFAKIRKLEIKKRPFINDPERSTKAHWVKPVLVAEFEYATTTRSGKIRKPAVFKGFRTDKKAIEIKLDEPAQLPGASVTTGNKKKKQSIQNEHSNWPELEQSFGGTTQNELTVEKHRLILNGIEKELWHGVTKADLINYYISVADYILPHLRKRPLSLHIKHNGVYNEGMYIKGMEGRQPEWMETFEIKRKHRQSGRPAIIDYAVCNDKPSLIYLVNLGCIDLNPWSSRVESYENPDYLVIDLDPTNGPFGEVVDAAKISKMVLDNLGLTAFPKTSGKTGIHIVIPVEPVFTFTQARKIVSVLCAAIQEQVPEITTISDSISQRNNKVFLDDNQNDFADTIASAYSVRPFHAPFVSMPFEWKELNSSLQPSDFTIRNSLQRIRKKGDLHKALYDRSGSRIKKKNTKVIGKLLESLSFNQIG
jgi:bifunctional non-homologous end joining protein LigD